MRLQCTLTGTNATFSAAAAGPSAALDLMAAAAGQLLPDSQALEPVFFESQQSLQDGGGLNGKRRVRKASFVEAPIYQAWHSTVCCASALRVLSIQEVT